MRLLAILACAMLSACSSAMQSTPIGSKPSVAEGEFIYMLPKGMVNVVVFADTKGVGITIEPAQIYKDSRAGEIVASSDLSIFNKETAETKASEVAGLLSMVMVDSEAQILEIVEAAAKSAARIALQNARAQFLAQRAVLLSISFDPLSPEDVKRASGAICHAVDRGRAAFEKTLSLDRIGSTECGNKPTPLVSLSVAHTDGSSDKETEFPTHDQLKAACKVGICARTMTTRVVRIEHNGVLLASHAVDVPSRNVVAVPIQNSVLGDRKTTVTVSSGILKEFKVEKESELLTLVQIPSTAIGGFFAGITDQLTAEKAVADKQKELFQSQTAALKAGKELETESLKLQSAPGGATGTTAYTSQALTAYLYQMGITELLDSIQAAPPPGPDTAQPGGDLLGNESPKAPGASNGG